MRTKTHIMAVKSAIFELCSANCVLLTIFFHSRLFRCFRCLSRSLSIATSSAYSRISSLVEAQKWVYYGIIQLLSRHIEEYRHVNAPASNCFSLYSFRISLAFFFFFHGFSLALIRFSRAVNIKDGVGVRLSLPFLFGNILRLRENEACNQHQQRSDATHTTQIISFFHRISLNTSHHHRTIKKKCFLIFSLLFFPSLYQCCYITQVVFRQNAAHFFQTISVALFIIQLNVYLLFILQCT